MFWRPYPFTRTSNTPRGGVKALGLHGVHVVGTLGLIDDAGVLGDTPQECARRLIRVRALVHMCGQRCNVGKFWGLHLKTRAKGIATVQRGLQWGTEGIPGARNDTHVRFLGGNANPVGWAVKILKEVKSGIKQVRPKLHYWPVSQAVGQMILEGVVVNKMIYRVVVNIPTEQMCDNMVGAITRAYRDVFGMARPTPREVYLRYWGWSRRTKDYGCRQ